MAAAHSAEGFIEVSKYSKWRMRPSNLREAMKHLLIDPCWRIVVGAEDEQYLEFLLGNFLEWAKSNRHSFQVAQFTYRRMASDPRVRRTDFGSSVPIGVEFLSLCSASAPALLFLLQSSLRSIINSGMQELLSNTIDPKAPLNERKSLELRLLDEANGLGTRYSVRHWHAEWSEVDRQIMWDQEEVEYFWILE